MNLKFIAVGIHLAVVGPSEFTGRFSCLFEIWHTGSHAPSSCEIFYCL